MHKIKKQKFLAPLLSLWLAVMVVLASTASALFAADTTPATINYQGRLLNSSSNPLAGNYTFRFSLWNSADWQAADTTGAGAINVASPRYAGWQETHAVTTNTYGLFNMSLGDTTAFPNFSNPTHTHLQVEVKATGDPDTSYEILDPAGTTADTNDRKPLSKEAFADNADTLDNADVGTAAGNLATLSAGGVWSISQIPGGTDADSFVIDNNNSAAGDIGLQFGNTLAKILSYSQANNLFNFNDDVNIGGDLTVGAFAETIANPAFTLSGNDVFIADSLGVEGAIYTDSTATKYLFLDLNGGVRGSAPTGTVAGGQSPVIRFDAAGNSFSRWSFPVPDDWVSGTDILVDVYWSPSDNTAGAIDFDLDFDSYAVTDTIAAGTFTDVIGAATFETVNLNTQLNLYSFTATLPNASIAADEMIDIRLGRTPADAGDTYAADINIHEVRLRYTGKKLL